MSRDGTRDWWRFPAMTTISYVILTLFGFAVILSFVKYHVVDERFIGTFEYRLWVMANALSLSVWIMLLMRGITMIRTLPQGWKRGKTWWTGNVAAYAVFSFSALSVMVLIRSGVDVPVPVQGFLALEGGLTLIAVIAAAPWVLIVWLTHEQARRSNFVNEGIETPEPADEFRYDKLDANAPHQRRRRRQHSR